MQIVERVLGVVLLATGIGMAFNLDVKFEKKLALDTSLPGFLTDPTSSLENSNAVQNQLASIRPESRSPSVRRRPTAQRPRPKRGTRSAAASLPNLGPAPNFTDNQDWFNTPGDKPLTIGGLRGHVVLVDFWTYTCINCIRTLPFVEGLYKHYHRYGLEVVGVETPEFTFEQDASNVRQAIHTDGITYPVVQDNHYGTWNAYQNEYWPAEYFIDANGEVRHTAFGEGNYLEDEQDLRELLTAAGAKHLPPLMTAKAVIPSNEIGTDETYLDPEREVAYQENFAQPLMTGVHSYSAPANVELDQWALDGSWDAGSQSITPAGAGGTITGGVQARDVYLVMTSSGNTPRRGRVLLGGKPIPAADRGTDVGPGGYFTVTNQRLYSLVKFTGDANFQITVQIPHGISAYDFTFG